jgi:hypothetical protein
MNYLPAQYVYHALAVRMNPEWSSNNFKQTMKIKQSKPEFAWGIDEKYENCQDSWFLSGIQTRYLRSPIS